MCSLIAGLWCVHVARGSWRCAQQRHVACCSAAASEMPAFPPPKAGKQSRRPLHHTCLALQAAVGIRGDVWVMGAQVRPVAQNPYQLSDRDNAWVASQSTCLHPANQSASPGHTCVLSYRLPCHCICPVVPQCCACMPIPAPPAVQNAGKSSLINAMRQAARLPKEKDVTTAPLPGTTLGKRPAGCMHGCPCCS